MSQARVVVSGRQPRAGSGRRAQKCQSIPGCCFTKRVSEVLEAMLTEAEAKSKSQRGDGRRSSEGPGAGDRGGDADMDTPGPALLTAPARLQVVLGTFVPFPCSQASRSFLLLPLPLTVHPWGTALEERMQS